MIPGVLPRSAFLAGLLVVLSTSGCSEPKFEEEPVKANLRLIGKAYFMIADYRKRPPKDEEELRTQLAELHTLQMGGPPAEVLVSPRDMQPIVIILGPGKLSDGSANVLAYEKVGADNSRYVLMQNGDIQKLSNEDFAKASFFNNHKPSAGG